MSEIRKKKYLLCPGYVTSKNDGDRHYVTATMLQRLYKVTWSECVVASPDNIEIRNRSDVNELIELHPDPSGKYKLPR